MPVGMNSGNSSKVIDANVPIAISFSPNDPFPVASKTNYNATVTWPIGTNSVNVAMVQS